MKKIIGVTLFVFAFLALSYLTLSASLLSASDENEQVTVTTKESKLENYSSIKLMIGAGIIYEQNTSSQPSIRIECDNKALEKMKIEVKEGSLHIGLQKGVKDGNLGNVKIYTNSKALNEINISGSGDVLVSSPLNVDKMNINIGGSGNVKIGNLKSETTLVSVGGSGDVKIDDLNSESMSVNIEGSGNVHLTGRSTTGTYQVTGSGSVIAGKLEQDNVSCSITGSGDILVKANKELTNNIIGSGSIAYKGNAKVSTSKSGSGSVKKLD